MKVLFVNPACLDQRVTDDDARQVPIGLYYLAALLLDQGIRASILNLAGQDRNQNQNPNQDQNLDPFEVLGHALDQVKPDIIGFSVTNPSRINAQACAGFAKKILPESLVVFGGPAPTFMADHLFKVCPHLDVIVQGEGETSFSALAKAVANKKQAMPRLDNIPGLIFRQGQTIVNTGPATLVRDLDTLPHPSRYFTFQHLSMSRGCPGRCTFCGSPRFWGTAEVRRHSPQWFFDEIQTLAAKGVSHFFISDDTFTMDRQAVAGLCTRIIEAGLNITWNAISRVDYIDEDILPLMRKAGCIQISFGVESGAPQIKKILGKPVDNDTCIRAFDQVKSYGILPRAYFIYGSPGETDDTIDQSIALMQRLGPLGAVFYVLVAFPGTALYTRARDKGWTHDSVWSDNIEDLPWFELDPDMDFNQVLTWGNRLRQAFYSGLATFCNTITLKDDPALYDCHADFLSRLAMTFSHGEFADHPAIDRPRQVAAALFEKALRFHPDPRAYLGLAMIAQQSRRFSTAITYLEKGLDHFPSNRELSVCMGVTLMNMGRFDRALAFFTPFDRDPGLVQYIRICQEKIRA